MEKINLEDSYEESSLICCGVAEIHGMEEIEKNSEDELFRLLDIMGTNGSLSAHYIFTAAKHPKSTTCKYLTLFKNIVKSNKLGTMLETEWRKNPGSGNLVKTIVLTPNIKTCEKLYKKLDEKYEINGGW